MDTSYIYWETEVRTDKGYIQLKTLYDLYKKGTKIKVATPDKDSSKIKYVPIKNMEEDNSPLYTLDIGNSWGSISANINTELLMYDNVRGYIDFMAINSTDTFYFPVSLNNDDKLMRIPTQDQRAVLTALRLQSNPDSTNNHTPFTPRIYLTGKNFAEWLSKGLNYKLINKIDNFDKYNCNVYAFDNSYGYLMGSHRDTWIDSINELTIFTLWYLNDKQAYFNVNVPIVHGADSDIKALYNKFNALGLDVILDDYDGYASPLYYVSNKKRLDKIIDTYYDESNDSFKYNIDNTINSYNCVPTDNIRQNATPADCYALYLDGGDSFFIKLGNKKNKKSYVSLIARSN